MRKPDTQSDSVAKLSQSNGSNFFASGLRQKVDQLMNVLWAGGVNNPMDSIEQLSYLIFLRLLSERDEQAALIEKGYQRIFSGEWARYAWGNFVTLTGNVAAVQAAVDAGAALVAQKGLLVNKVVIPAPRPELLNEMV